jgi:hypothetical protein
MMMLLGIVQKVRILEKNGKNQNYFVANIWSFILTISPYLQECHALHTIQYTQTITMQ